MSTGESQRIAERAASFIRANKLDTFQGGTIYKGHSAKGVHYWAVDMGVPATLDGTIQIYNKNFIVTSISPRFGRMTFKSEQELMDFLEENFKIEESSPVERLIEETVEHIFNNVLVPDEIKKRLNNLVAEVRKEYENND